MDLKILRHSAIVLSSRRQEPKDVVVVMELVFCSLLTAQCHMLQSGRRHETKGALWKIPTNALVAVCLLHHVAGDAQEGVAGVLLGIDGAAPHALLLSDRLQEPKGAVVALGI